ncbi:MAG: glycosyltransferase family 4 protein [Bacteroidales bacterium]|nr:glycosyltransferase family 4 protein [Bacteroidales bacterium]
MGESVPRIIVVSAVNIRKGGTLTILRECLQYLSGQPGLKVYALVHNKSLCEYSGIEYLGFPWTIKGWSRRLWCEYVTMSRISKVIEKKENQVIDTWLSLHDTTPRVKALHREVYCHTSFPFLKWNLRDFIMNPKIPLFAMFTRFAYRINVHKNDCLIVQQEWFREGLSRITGYPLEKIRVIPPTVSVDNVTPEVIVSSLPVFLYVSTADCHKNFETLCRAARLLENEIGGDKFRVVLTISGDENRYARWIKKNWGDVSSIEFAGLMSKEKLFGYYKAASCFIFPSRIETWGLPITEYMLLNGGRMLLADLPYAHETSEGKGLFFPVTDAKCLKQMMYESLTIR